jgi:CRISPR-associated endonuclease Cas3-HD
MPLDFEHTTDDPTKTARPALAHVAEDGRVHPLDEHLAGTAQRASRFAAEFGCAGWGYLAGLWHDLGKYSPDFQRKIHVAAGQDAHLEAKARVDHSTAGAIHAVDRFGPLGRILAYAVAGHHAGLPDWTSDATGGAALEVRLRNTTLLEAAKTGWFRQRSSSTRCQPKSRHQVQTLPFGSECSSRASWTLTSWTPKRSSIPRKRLCAASTRRCMN